MRYQLAQANVAYLLAPADSPLVAEYMARLDEINGLADRSPGFVWRYLTDSRDPAQRVFSDPLVLFNMSLWDSIESLHAFTYKSVHSEVYAARKKWFASTKAVVGGNALAMWWMPEGMRPTVREAKNRLELVTASGPSEQAFTFKQRFDAPAIRR